MFSNAKSGLFAKHNSNPPRQTVRTGMMAIMKHCQHQECGCVNMNCPVILVRHGRHSGARPSMLLVGCTLRVIHNWCESGIQAEKHRANQDTLRLVIGRIGHVQTVQKELQSGKRQQRYSAMI